MRTWTVATCRGAWPARRAPTCHRIPVLREAPPLGPARGFTVLELALVLFIVGLLLTVAIPRLADLPGARLEASARRFAALVRYLSGEAVFRSHVYRLHYDLDRHSYWVTVLAVSQQAAEFVGDESPLSRPVQLPPAVRFADVHVPAVGRVSTGQVYTHFYPYGYADPTVIHLRDHSARVLTIVIPPLIGEVRIYDGYVDGFAGH
ncbi:MAG: prepilin-type N-terminal cleavage/methylation domain-containing protein [Candidatus Binatia bacterium]|nr:prepilin-type N-terminal cleavage/methylation domain-containing protein [Candidatus Binatia bacterium]